MRVGERWERVLVGGSVSVWVGGVVVVGGGVVPGGCLAAGGGCACCRGWDCWSMVLNGSASLNWAWWVWMNWPIFWRALPAR